jgi:hypothetical protein
MTRHKAQHWARALSVLLLSCAPSTSPRDIRPAAVVEDCVGTNVESVNVDTYWYVAPQSVAAGEASILLTGSPSYMARATDSPDPVEVWDTVVGIIFHEDGAIHPVPHPMPGVHMGLVRAAHLEGHSWAVLLVEVEDPPSRSGPDRFVRVWIGVYGREGWRSVVPVDESDTEDLRFANSSDLIELNGTLTWAVPTRRMNGLEEIVVFEGSEDTWSATRIPMLGAHEVAALTHLWFQKSPRTAF